MSKKCAVCVPVASALEPQTEDLLRELSNRGYAVRMLRGSSQVDLARSSLATEAIREGFESTFWIDSDMHFNPDDVETIVESSQPFLAGMYPAKGPRQFVGKMRDLEPVVFGYGGSIIQVQYVGMGFTYIHGSVYEAIMKAGMPVCGGGYGGKTVIPFFIPMIELTSGDYLSEDYSFCSRARSVGFPPMVDTRLKVGHIGKHVYTWDDLPPPQIFESVTVNQRVEGEIKKTD